MVITVLPTQPFWLQIAITLLIFIFLAINLYIVWLFSSLHCLSFMWPASFGGCLFGPPFALFFMEKELGQIWFPSNLLGFLVCPYYYMGTLLKPAWTVPGETAVILTFSWVTFPKILATGFTIIRRWQNFKAPLNFSRFKGWTVTNLQHTPENPCNIKVFLRACSWVKPDRDKNRYVSAGA